MPATETIRCLFLEEPASGGWQPEASWLLARQHHRGQSGARGVEDFHKDLAFRAFSDPFLVHGGWGAGMCSGTNLFLITCGGKCRSTVIPTALVQGTLWTPRTVTLMIWGSGNLAGL